MSLTKEIQSIICKAELRKGNLVAENFNFFFDWEQDVISLNKTGYTSEFEVKISRADFKADFKKRKWVLFKDKAIERLPNYFTCVCPPGLIDLPDLQDYMGLIYIEDGMPVIVRKPKLIHKSQKDIVKLLTKMLTVNNWHHYFGAQKPTIMNREAKESNEPQLHDSFISTVKTIHKRNNQPQCPQCTTPFTNEVDAVGCCEGINQ